MEPTLLLCSQREWVAPVPPAEITPIPVRVCVFKRSSTSHLLHRRGRPSLSFETCFVDGEVGLRSGLGNLGVLSAAIRLLQGAASTSFPLIQRSFQSINFIPFSNHCKLCSSIVSNDFQAFKLKIEAQIYLSANRSSTDIQGFA